MKSLQGLMSELTETIGRANAAAGINLNTSLAQKRANRSSVANLEAMWSSHLQALWKRVEGSQKFLPATPGRHIVYESGRWVELNVATWKAKRRVHIILLNDHVLVAVEKKNTEAISQSPRDAASLSNHGHVQHVAYRCWPLQDVQLIDLAEENEVAKTYLRDDRLKNSSAITLRSSSESFTFAAAGSDVAEKEALIVTYRRALEEIRRATEADNGRRGNSRRSGAGMPTREKASAFLTSGMDATADQRDLKAFTFVDGEGKQQNLRWVEGQFDSLDIHTALQEFEEAVTVVEKLRRVARNIKNDTLALDFMNRELDAKASSLASVIAKELAETHSQMTATQENVGWLLRLGFDARARTEYLGARSININKKTRCLMILNLIFCTVCLTKFIDNVFSTEISSRTFIRYLSFTLPLSATQLAFTRAAFRQLWALW